MFSVVPSPTPYPDSGNGIVDSWHCENVFSPEPAPSTGTVITGQDCAVTHYTATRPDVVTSSGTAVPASTPYPGGYTPGDTGNWGDIGPWWAAFVAAGVIAPFALKTFVRWVREFLR